MTLAQSQTLDYRAYLGELLAQRARKNPQLSLRAMARFLGMSPSSLSEVLSSRKNLSEDRLHQLIERLRLSTREARYLNALYQFNRAKLPSRKLTALENVNRLRNSSPISDLQLDQFSLIAQWYSPVIFELTKVSAFKVTAPTVARALGISVPEAREALHRLERLRLIRQESGVFTCAVDQEILVVSPHLNEALREFHESMLVRIREALTNQPPDERLSRTETFAFDPNQLPEVEEILDEAFQRILLLARKAKSPTTVYHLHTQFIRMTKGKLKI